MTELANITLNKHNEAIAHYKVDYDEWVDTPIDDIIDVEYNYDKHTLASIISETLKENQDLKKYIQALRAKDMNND